MGRRPIYSDEQLIIAITASQGFVSLAAQHLQISARSIYLRAQNSPAIREAIAARMELHLDVAESKLLKAINAGEMWAIKLFLLTRGKHRGYTYKSHTVVRGDDTRFIPPVVVASKPVPSSMELP